MAVEHLEHSEDCLRAAQNFALARSDSDRSAAQRWLNAVEKSCQACKAERQPTAVSTAEYHEWQRVIHDKWVEEGGCERCFGLGVTFEELTRYQRYARTSGPEEIRYCNCPTIDRLRTGVDPDPRTSTRLIKILTTMVEEHKSVVNNARGTAQHNGLVQQQLEEDAQRWRSQEESRRRNEEMDRVAEKRRQANVKGKKKPRYR